MRSIAFVLVVGLVACKTPASRDKDCLAGSDGAEGILDKLDKTIGDDPAELPELRERVAGVCKVAEDRCAKAQAPSSAKILAGLKTRADVSRKLLDAEAARQKKDPNILKRGKKPGAGFFSGAVSECEDMVKERLKDPNSYEHQSTGVTEDGPTWKVMMSYKARNSFGGLNIESQTCWMQGGKVVRSTMR